MISQSNSQKLKSLGFPTRLKQLVTVGLELFCTQLLQKNSTSIQNLKAANRPKCEWSHIRTKNVVGESNRCRNDHRAIRVWGESTMGRIVHWANRRRFAQLVSGFGAKRLNYITKMRSLNNCGTTSSSF